jgi:hypothetical protein
MLRQRLIKCYHVSFTNKRKSILEEGLVPKDNEAMGYKNRLFFSTDKNNLGFDYVDYSNVDVWSFVIPKKSINLDKNAWKRCFCYTTESIPASKLKLEETIN